MVDLQDRSKRHKTAQVKAYLHVSADNQHPVPGLSSREQWLETKEDTVLVGRSRGYCLS
uniref:Uncharacterized protein n=1 Tax=Arion vulgaris TaxID=1028688 RepID=A0A0B6ZE68_9EUPU